MQTNLTGKDHKVDGWVVTLQKRMVGNPHQMWKFNDDATIASKVSRTLFGSALDLICRTTNV